MVTELERKQRIPETLRKETGIAYCYARTVQPASKPEYIRHTLSCLIIGSKKTGEYQNYEEMFSYCNECCAVANRLYKAGNWDRALHLCNGVLDEIGELVHAGFGIIPENGFALPTSGGSEK